jgi:hypothetical protein
MKQLRSAKNSQRGAVLAIFAIAMLAIIAIAGLALDLSHAYVDKTRMQNVLDATAMSGAMTLSLLGNDAAAETAARDDAIATFDAALQAEFSTAGVSPTIEFSRTLDPFVPGSSPAIFVRAKVDRYDMPTWLAKVIGKDSIRLGGSAVSGPVNADTCRLSPLVVCGDPTDTCLPGAATCHGYNVWRDDSDPEEQCYLKNGSQPIDLETGENCASQDGSGVGTSSGDVGPGNFQLLDLDRLDEQPQCSGGGAAFLRCALAKGVNACPDGGTVPTKPGNTTGPTAQGLNTNFCIYNGPVSRSEYPPDLVTDYDNPSVPNDAGVVFYDEYRDRTNNGGSDWDNPSDGIANRRVKAVIIGNCDAAGCTGACDMPVMAIGCFLLTQPTEQKGNEQRVWGQFIGECGGTGNPTLNPSAFTQQKIILYKDPDSTDS